MRKECNFGYWEFDHPKILKFTITKGDPNLDDLREYRDMNIEVVEGYVRTLCFCF